MTDNSAIFEAGAGSLRLGGCPGARRSGFGRRWSLRSRCLRGRLTRLARARRARGRRRGRGGDRWRWGGLRLESRRNLEHGQDEDQHEDDEHRQHPGRGQPVLAGAKRAAVARLPGFAARVVGRHRSGWSPLVDGLRAESRPSVADARCADARSCSSVAATRWRATPTRSRSDCSARTEVTASVQTRSASETITSPARTTTARSRISPTAREG